MTDGSDEQPGDPDSRSGEGGSQSDDVDVSAGGNASSGSVELVGTAHVSAESVERVEAAIEEHRPDVVAVELDESRYRQLKGDTPADIDPRDLLSGGAVFQLLAYWLLSYVQARLGEKFGVDPGADMRAAVEAAESRGIDVALVDRDIQVTIRRFWRRMTLWQKLKLLGSLVASMLGFGPDLEEGGLEDFDVEDLTDTDVVTAMLEEFRRFSPGGAEALIDERDAFIAHKLVDLREAGLHVVAVVGAGHREGIERYLADPASLPPRESLTGSGSRSGLPWGKMVGYGFTLGFLVFFGLLFMAGVRDRFLLKLFAAWFAINGIFAFTFAKVAGARWSSATVGGLVAWMTSINPLLAPGWFTGYLELRHRPVNIADVSTMNEILGDTESPMRVVLSNLTDVPLFRLVAIVAMTNVGSIVASGLFVTAILPTMSGEIGGVGGISEHMVDGAERSARLIWEAL
jgi:pheromone shutdown-related protein TraB